MRKRPAPEEMEKVVEYMGNHRFWLADGLFSAGLIGLLIFLFR
ncbi:hypothetical protein [Metabacillus mangrovi]|nr:hypothetical protein [Metabacillus mangrovi]